MTYTEQNKKEALQILEACTPEQWKHLRNFVGFMTRQPAPEEQRQQEERQQKEREQRRAEKESQEAGFEGWKEKRLKGFKLPSERYDIGISDIDVFVQYLGFYGLQIDRVYKAVGALYDYGFKQGVKFQKNKAKIKGQATI